MSIVESITSSIVLSFIVLLTYTYDFARSINFIPILSFLFVSLDIEISFTVLIKTIKQFFTIFRIFNTSSTSITFLNIRQNIILQSHNIICTDQFLLLFHSRVLHIVDHSNCRLWHLHLENNTYRLSLA